MSASTSDRLYNLLPAIYRQRDLTEGQPLRALLAVVERELRVIEVDVDRLYDNWFVETCDDWVVPYIGDLLGVRGLLPLREGVFSQRAQVANTLGYRRRKGTAAMLEQLARDVTGWPARVVESFELLATTQYLNHVRLGKGMLADLHDSNTLELLGGPFERAAHTADVRHVDNGRGRYNIANIGIFLWRLQSYPLARATARAVPAPTPPHAGRYTFSPLGLAGPLFNRPRTEAEATDLASEANVPAPLRRRPLHDELEARRQAIVDGKTPRGRYFGDQPVLGVIVDGAAVPAAEIAVCNLSDPPSPIPSGWRRPSASRGYTPAVGGAEQLLPIQVAVDPILGRLAFTTGVTPNRVEVSYASGFPGDLGGGPYGRREALAALSGPVAWQRGVTRDAPANQSLLSETIAEAVQAWNQQPPGTIGVIAVMDNATYAENLTGANAITIPAGSQLAIVAAGWPEEDVPDQPGLKRRVDGHISPVGLRPHVLGNLSVRGTAAADDPGTLIVNGLLIEGAVTALIGNLGSLEMVQSTLAPGSGGLTVNSGAQAGQQNERLTVILDRAISGRVIVPDGVRALVVRDSIVDGGAGPALAGPASAIETSTILGETTVRSLEADNSIFSGRVTVTRRQTGCIRFCYLPPDSQAPRRYRCQPADLASALRVSPRFTSAIYGAPGYCQLATDGPVEISAGAEDEGEMGAFNFLQQTRRMANLSASLDEYLRFGLEAGVLLAT